MSLYAKLLKQAQLRRRALQDEREALLLRMGRQPRRRRPPEAGLPVPAIPPGGPLPKQGGAEAPLDYSA